MRYIQVLGNTSGSYNVIFDWVQLNYTPPIPTPSPTPTATPTPTIGFGVEIRAEALDETQNWVGFLDGQEAPAIIHRTHLRYIFTITNLTNSLSVGPNDIEGYGFQVAGFRSVSGSEPPLPRAEVEDLTDLPAGLTYLQHQPGGYFDDDAGAVGWDLPLLINPGYMTSGNGDWLFDPGETIEVTITGRANYSGTHEIRAEVVDEAQQINAQATFETRVPVTLLDLERVHSGLRAAMFWAIYHETSEGTFLTYNPDPTSIPCYELGWGPNSKGAEVIRAVHNESSLFDECREHYYLEAQAMLNGIFSTERRVGPDLVYTYFTGNNYVASLGNRPNSDSSEYYDVESGASAIRGEKGSNWLWLRNECWPNGQSYREALATNSQQVILDWLEQYLTCQASLWRGDAGTDARAQHHADLYDELYDSQNSFINQAVQDIAQCEDANYAAYAACDPTQGGFGIMNANDGGVSYMVPVDDCRGDSIESALLAAGHSNILQSFKAHMFQVGSPQYGGNPKAYPADNSQVLQPAIAFSYSNAPLYAVAACQWISITYPQSTYLLHYPR